MFKILLYWLVLVNTIFGFSEDSFEKHIFFNAKGQNLVGYIPIEMEHPIDQSTYIRIKLSLDYFKKRKVSFVILDLNTPGGEVFASQKICNLLIEMDASCIPCIAFIDNWAISAGAMLAYSCRFIGITKKASMGASEPIMIDQSGEMKTASEKVNSALRSEFMNLASYFGRNPYIAEAMVDKDVILVLRRGEIIKLNEEKEIQKGDKIISPKNKLLTLNARDLIDYKIADFQSPPLAKGKLFQTPFFEKIPNVEILTYNDWRVDLFAFLSHPAVSSLLVAVMLICFYLEMQSFGSIFGIISLSALLAILLSHFAIYAVAWIELIILLTGILLLLLEIFIIPGFGITGILGIILTLLGLFTLMLPNLKDVRFSFTTNEFNLTGVAAIHHLAYLLLSFLVSCVAILLLARWSSKNSFLKKIIHEKTSEKYETSFPKIGSKAITLTPLRPSGKIEVEGEVFDASSLVGFIDKGESVTIVSYENGTIVVYRTGLKNRIFG